MNQNQRQNQNHQAASSAGPTLGLNHGRTEAAPKASLALSGANQVSSLTTSGALESLGQTVQLHNLRACQQSSSLQNKLQQLSSSARNEPEPEGEQSALEMAHSAAVLAAAKFKMLRSNTLAAAFGRPAEQQAAQSPSLSPSPLSAQPSTGTAGSTNQAWDLLASLRVKDERIVSTLSPPINRIQQ